MTEKQAEAGFVLVSWVFWFWAGFFTRDIWKPPQWVYAIGRIIFFVGLLMAGLWGVFCGG